MPTNLVISYKLIENEHPMFTKQEIRQVLTIALRTLFLYFCRTFTRQILSGNENLVSVIFYVKIYRD